jgi:hypothetical protein
MKNVISRRSFLGAALTVPLAGCGSRAGVPGSGAVAFSLRQAELLVRAGRSSNELSSLAGINRLIGVVHDAARADIVLVGRSIAGAMGLTLDDLAVAIQARLVHHEWPLVSIDRVSETDKTGVQKIRWEGHIASKALGAKLLSADEFLKKAALGLREADHLPFMSYFDLCAAKAQAGTFSPGGRRFWFRAADAALLSRADVFVLQELGVGVQAQAVDGTATQKDETADQYAATFTTHFARVAQAHPPIAALIPIFDAVAAAEGIEMLPPQATEFWAHQYQPARVQTPSEYPLVKRQGRLLEKDKKDIELELNGGIDTKVFIQKLRDRDYMAFQETVLKTRPRSDILSWSLPLSSWGQDVRLQRVEEKALDSVTGTTINGFVTGGSPAAPSMPFSPRGGVYTDIPVSESDIRKK